MHKQLKLALLGSKEAWHIKYAAAVMNALYEAKDERNSSTHCKKVAELQLLSDHMGDRGNGRSANCKGHSKRYTNKAKRETVAV